MDILLIIKTLIMGLVEGATEFLPISSTGHLIIAGDLLNFLSKEKRDVFEIIIQLGAVLAVCVAFRQRLLHTALNVTTSQKSQGFVLNLFIAFLPLAILGLVFGHQIKAYLFSPITVAITLILGGFAILWIEKNVPKSSTTDVEAMTKKQALQVGFAQALALIPGMSRAGATILGGMMFGLNRQTATEFSFFLALPVMFAATGYDLIKNRDLLDSADAAIFALGFVAAFVSALLVIKVFLRFVANHDFKAFAYYRIVFGSVVLLYFIYKPH